MTFLETLLLSRFYYRTFLRVVLRWINFADHETVLANFNTCFRENSLNFYEGKALLE